MGDETKLSLNKIDVAVFLAKGTFGALTYIGPIISEIIGTIIPNQRLDRISDFLSRLDEKVKNLNNLVT